jgi:hypothetical protein
LHAAFGGHYTGVGIINENGREKEIIDYFSSNDYEKSVFDVSVEVCGMSKASSASVISMLDSCLSSGKISIETYVKAYPDSALANKTELLKQIELEKNSEIVKLRNELKELKSRKSM